MLQAFQKLTTTYLRVTVLRALPIIGIAIAGPWLLRWLIQYQSQSFVLTEQDASEPTFSGEQMSLYMNFVCIVFLVNVAAAWSALPDIVLKAKISLLPVSSKLLSTFLWLVPACVVMGVNVVIQYCYTYLFQNEWPILTTTFCFGAFSMIFMAGGWWLRDFRFYKIPVLLAVIAIWGYWFAQHFYPDGFQNRIESWDIFSIGDCAVLLATAIGSWIVIDAAFAKYRCGEVSFGKIQQYLEQPPYAIVADNAPEAVKMPASESAYEGFVAMEWTKGRPMAVCTAVVVSLLLILSVFAAMNNRRSNPVEGMVAMLIINAGVCGIMLGAWMAVEAWSTQAGGMKQFLATLPFSDADLARGCLKICARCVAVSIPILIMAVVAAFVLYNLFIERIDISNMIRDAGVQTRFSPRGLTGVLLMLMSAPVVGWVVCGMVASVMATGRQWVVMVSTVVPAAVGFLVIALPTFFGAWGERIAVILGIIFLPGLAFFGTIVLFILAFRQQLIENNVAVKCGAIAVAFIALIAVFVRADLYQTLVFSSAGCLVVTPIAAFPLAVAWNRHR